MQKMNYDNSLMIPNGWLNAVRIYKVQKPENRPQ